jgi:lysozyme
MLYGVDLSSWQAAFRLPDTGIDFAIVKASGGGWYRNPAYADQLSDARGKDALIGHYHYAFEGEPQGAEREADWFTGTLDWRGGERVALDLEEGAGDLAAWALAWGRRVRNLLGIRPLLYSYESFLRAHGLLRDDVADVFDLWLASWQESPPPAPGPWGRIDTWQYNSRGVVVGYGPLDLNRYWGTQEDWIAAGGLVAQRKEPPDKGFPGALQPDGSTVLNGVDFGGIAESVVRVDVTVRNSAGAHYRRTWAGHELFPWEMV